MIFPVLSSAHLDVLVVGDDSIVNNHKMISRARGLKKEIVFFSSQDNFLTGD